MPVRFLAKAKPFGDYPIADTEDIQHGTKRLDVALSDIETVNERKADKTYVDTELAKKADSTTVSALDTRVCTNETNIATQTARIDKLSNYVTPQMYGAVGDGITDDTTAIQSAINNCLSKGGGTVLFPNGTYIVAGTIVCDNDSCCVNLVGNGDNSLIKYTGSGVLFEYSHTTPYHKYLIENLHIDTIYRGSNIAFYLHGVDACCNVVFNNNAIWNFGTCIQTDSECDEWNILSNHFVGYRNYGIKLNGGPNSAWNLIGNHFQAGLKDSYAFYGACGRIGFVNNCIQSNESISAIYLHDQSHLFLSNLYYEVLDQTATKTCIELANFINADIFNLSNSGCAKSVIKTTNCKEIVIHSITHSKSGGLTTYIIDNDSTSTIKLHKRFPYSSDAGFISMSRNRLNYNPIPYLNNVSLSTELVVNYCSRDNASAFDYVEFDISSGLIDVGNYFVSICQDNENYYYLGMILVRNSSKFLQVISENGLSPSGHEISFEDNKIKVFNAISATRTFSISVKRMV